MCTCVDKSSWCTFTELLSLVGQCNLNYTRDVSWWGLNTDGMWCDQLKKNGHFIYYIVVEGMYVVLRKCLISFMFMTNKCVQNKMVLLTSLHTSMVPNTTCRPSKKLSPMMITVVPPVVQPSLGQMALIVGVAEVDKGLDYQIFLQNQR